MSVPTDVARRTLIEQLREATELLESIASDRTVLAGVPDAERARLLQAVALVYHPDRVERRRMAKVTTNQRRAARVKETEQARLETGIRELRRKPVFHTPNVFPPESFKPMDVHELNASNVSNASNASNVSNASNASNVSNVSNDS